MRSLPLRLSACYASFERFFFEVGDARICAVLRIGFGLLLIPYLWVLGLDLFVFFGENGVLPYEISTRVLDPDASSVLRWLAPGDGALSVCYVVFWLNAVLLLFGVGSRFQAFAVFFWLLAFQHRNALILDGEDVLARWIAFTLIWMPCGEHWSVDAWRCRLKGIFPRERCLLGLKLLQVEMTLIYASTALLKLDGVEWLNGHAVIYAVQLTDLFGRFPLPAFFLQSAGCLMAVTWIVLCIECFLPWGLWFKETRKWAILLGVGLHLSLDYAMNLFLFQWFMILGLMSFLHFCPSTCKSFINNALRRFPVGGRREN